MSIPLPAVKVSCLSSSAVLTEPDVKRFVEDSVGTVSKEADMFLTVPTPFVIESGADAVRFVAIVTPLEVVVVEIPAPAIMFGVALSIAVLTAAPVTGLVVFELSTAP